MRQSAKSWMRKQNIGTVFWFALTAKSVCTDSSIKKCAQRKIKMLNRSETTA